MRNKTPRPDVVIYTDVATSTRIVAALVIDANSLSNTRNFDILWAETSDPTRGETFASAALIYGLEILAILAKLVASAAFLWGGDVTFYIDNSNCANALVSVCTKTTAVGRMVKLFWPQIQKIGISAWFELASSDLNTVDATTRWESAAFPSRGGGGSKFGFLEALSLRAESSPSISYDSIEIV